MLGPRDGWSTTDAARAVGAAQGAARRARQVARRTRRAGCNLVGYTLRPGFGYPLDDWRVKETWRLFNAGVVHDKDDPCRLEWWILWRRVSGGLTRTQQDEIYKRIAPHFLPSFAKKAERKPPGAARGGGDVALPWRRWSGSRPSRRPSSATCCSAHLEKKKVGERALWALVALGARVPLYGAPRTWWAQGGREVARARAGAGVEGRDVRAGGGGAGARVGRSRARPRFRASQPQLFSSQCGLRELQGVLRASAKAGPRSGSDSEATWRKDRVCGPSYNVSVRTGSAVSDRNA